MNFHLAYKYSTYFGRRSHVCAAFLQTTTASVLAQVMLFHWRCLRNIQSHKAFATHHKFRIFYAPVSVPLRSQDSRFATANQISVQSRFSLVCPHGCSHVEIGNAPNDVTIACLGALCMFLRCYALSVYIVQLITLPALDLSAFTPWSPPVVMPPSQNTVPSIGNHRVSHSWKLDHSHVNAMHLRMREIGTRCEMYVHIRCTVRNDVTRELRRPHCVANLHFGAQSCIKQFGTAKCITWLGQCVGLITHVEIRDNTHISGKCAATCTAYVHRRYTVRIGGTWQESYDARSTLRSCILPCVAALLRVRSRTKALLATSVYLLQLARK